jgi:hypothetical protein
MIPNEAFFNPLYGFLRHAQDARENENTVLHGDSCDYLVMTCTRLEQTIPQSKIAIFYSPPTRAALTATVVKGILRDTKKIVTCEKLPWLGDIEFDEKVEAGVTDVKIKKLQAEYPDTFIIFISHQPDIESYAKLPEKSVLNCTFLAREFTFPGHEKFENRMC